MIRELDYDSETYYNRAEEFNVLEDTELIEDLKETISTMSDRVYLCANEVGVNKRVFVIKFGDEIKAFSNPVYQVRENFELVREKYQDKEYIIPRYKDITLCYQDENGDTKATKFNEEASPFMSQAMDCLDGLHASDYGLEVLPEFDEATEEEQRELISLYINSLKDLQYRLDKDLSEDEETKYAWKNFKFNQGIEDGDIKKYEGDDLVKAPERKYNRKERRFLDRFAKRMAKKKRGTTVEIS